jgi:hypothetical protein
MALYYLAGIIVLGIAAYVVSNMMAITREKMEMEN